MIPLVFSKKNPSDAEVRKNWEILFNHRLGPLPPASDAAAQHDHANRAVMLLINLLISLAKALNYNFDENDIRRIYSPRGHEQELAENQEARRLLLKLLRGEQPLKIQEEHKES